FVSNGSGDSKNGVEMTMDIQVKPSGTISVTTSDGVVHETDKDGNTTKKYPWLHANDFERLVEKNWDRLDRDGDGHISRQEIDKAVTDNSFTGEDAAMVVALKERMADIQSLDGMGIFSQLLSRGLTKDDIKNFDEIRKDLDKQVSHNQDVRDFIERRFNDIDTGKDGKISLFELMDAYNDKDKFNDKEREQLKELVHNYGKLGPWIFSALSKEDLDRYAKLPVQDGDGKIVDDVRWSLQHPNLT